MLSLICIFVISTSGTTCAGSCTSLFTFDVASAAKRAKQAQCTSPSAFQPHPPSPSPKVNAVAQPSHPFT
jgi:hypothetical protein